MINSKWNLDYKEIFNNTKNITIYYILIPELQKILILNFHLLINQLLSFSN